VIGALRAFSARKAPGRPKLFVLTASINGDKFASPFRKFTRR
jgi:hypothetical protein